MAAPRGRMTVPCSCPATEHTISTKHAVAVLAAYAAGELHMVTARGMIPMCVLTVLD